MGIVVIGRNEGERLRCALESVRDLGHPAVYVDSGSTDGSADLARALDVPVVELAADLRYTAARARNAGLERLRTLTPDLEFVQFLDGDCELAPGWLAHAVRELARHPECAVIAGYVDEAAAAESAFQRLCQIEWNALRGDELGTGGNMLARAAALRAVGGFDARIVAGEDTELCARLRSRGWRIRPLAVPMVRHDADMTRLGQWWRRTVRNGYGFAQCACLPRPGGPPVFRREYRSVWVWGAVVPALALAGAWPTGGWSLLLLGAYGLPAVRAWRSARRRGERRGDATLYAGHCLVGKFAQFVGIVRFHRERTGAPRSASLPRAAAAPLPEALVAAAMRPRTDEVL